MTISIIRLFNYYMLGIVLYVQESLPSIHEALVNIPPKPTRRNFDSCGIE